MCLLRLSPFPSLLLDVPEIPVQLFGHRGEVLLGEELGAHEEAGDRGAQQHHSHRQRLPTEPVGGERGVDEASVRGGAVLEAKHVPGKPVQLGEEGRRLADAERRFGEKRLRGGRAARQGDIQNEKYREWLNTAENSEAESGSAKSPIYDRRNWGSRRGGSRWSRGSPQ